ncbi:hypothetical protein, partial [Collinsella sp. AF19-1LB]|uniref:hypothetical protein n=1 Tax=Collinsella sp. AF19-1LB TaxID=2292219 RepID=UPI001F28BABD
DALTPRLRAPPGSGQKGPNMSTVTKLVASIFRSRAAKSPCLEPDRDSEERKSMHFWPLAPIFEAIWLPPNW